MTDMNNAFKPEMKTHTHTNTHTQRPFGSTLAKLWGVAKMHVFLFIYLFICIEIMPPVTNLRAQLADSIVLQKSYLAYTLSLAMTQTMRHHFLTITYFHTNTWCQ